ncbi:hypothetical protein NBRC10512_007279 [Rhodotorula toruloides]|uniref:RHTO0S14e05050g1_1 n=2 Tax=Rhodotorula toruloides TaxID=5286 RepID=A0A061BKK6_RHOTO|nr:ribonuclease H-like domain containing protein [Rhodotorula toruloides NP11]EMS24928.1 ribonuclease H-like domain containing protein [Rhodotorula toruloides NP11]CDR47541.1 RHTO0S14e05050g1_1 [Rhodotorula toruloides]
MAQQLPAVFAQLKYVCFSWPNTQLLKRDPIARTWFKSHCTITTLPAALGGWPLTLYEAVASSTQSVPELFLSQQQCDTLLNSLAELMGPSRARASWRDSAWHKREALIRSSAQAGGIKVHVFHSQAELEARFAELKDGDDWAATKTHWRELKRAQEVFQWLGSGATKRPALGEPKFVAVDIETWELDHALVTEVGVASLRYLQSGKMVTEARHLVLQENSDKRNGRYCPDARDYFQLGQTVTLPRQRLARELHDTLFPSDELAGPIILLLHDHRSDSKSLASLDVDLNKYERNPLLPPPESPLYNPPDSSDAIPDSPPCFLLDTQRLFSGFSRRKRQSRLEDACRALGIVLPGNEPIAYHNSGNDAWVTLQVFLRLMQTPIGETADEVKPAGWTPGGR